MKKVKFDFDRQLHSVPVRNSKVKIIYPENNTEVIIAEVELKYSGIISIAAKIFGSRKRKGYELEGVAREIYEKLDGKKTVEDLVLDFAKDEKLGFLESRALIVQYLKNLMEKGLVVIVGDDKFKD
jgi:hypothetical protein